MTAFSVKVDYNQGQDLKNAISKRYSPILMRINTVTVLNFMKIGQFLFEIAFPGPYHNRLLQEKISILPLSEGVWKHEWSPTKKG